jgi:hypothetical protein
MKGPFDRAALLAIEWRLETVVDGDRVLRRKPPVAGPDEIPPEAAAVAPGLGLGLGVEIFAFGELPPHEDQGGGIVGWLAEFDDAFAAQRDVADAIGQVREGATIRVEIPLEFLVADGAKDGAMETFHRNVSLKKVTEIKSARGSSVTLGPSKNCSQGERVNTRLRDR